ncbi:MAG: FAD-dependent oxidoreductase [Fuerstiella sp.]|nr:FAD-dependent oxidoreductase [Fuerstiella sp.]
MTSDFWRPRLETQRRTLVPFAFEKTQPGVEHLQAARDFLNGKKVKDHRPNRFIDSDLYKVMEGAAYLLQLRADPKLGATLDEIAEVIECAQHEHGYLYPSHTTGAGQSKNMMGDAPYTFIVHSHELYNVGHLYEAAIAYYQATGKDKLLKVAEKSAQHINRVVFEGDPNYNAGMPILQAPGHQEMELALVKLFRITGRQLYLDMARKFLEIRGVTYVPDGDGVMSPTYAQQHAPVLDQQEAVGHAVRATYLYSAMADIGTFTALPAADRESNSPDVLIYGATPAGIAAALAAAEGDRKVWLVEPTARIGGLTTHGLSHSDFHSFEALSGPFLQFSQRVLQHYRDAYGEDSEQVRDSWRGTHGEPSVNLMIFEKMLAEKPTITVLKEHRLIDVTTENQSITAGRFSLPDKTTITIEARLFIDASYDGDLLASAGVPYRVGREARSEYGESLAPETADEELQGYNFRLCMTQNPTNRVPIPVPEDYDREDYADLIPLVEAGKFKSAFGYPGRPFVLKAHLPVLPNGKHDINDVSKGLVRLSLPGHNLKYPDGDLATRRRIEQEHLDWQLGLIHFVQTDPALPEEFRKEAATWGLCGDEFTETDHIPPQIYVREARRMVGLRVYTEADTEYAPNDARSRLHPDSIAVGEYSHNCHGTDHEGPMIGGRHTGEFYKGVAPYQIPYGVIMPKKTRNLLVPTACSASHVGFCAIRLEPIWISLGGAAGHAVNMALEANIPVQQVDVRALQKRIWSQGGATIHVSDVPPGHPDFAAVQWWAGLGGLHGVEPAPAKPGTRGKQIVSQYFEAFPGHAAKLDQPLDDALRNRWAALAKQHHLIVPAESTTRGDWIREVFAASTNLSAKEAAQGFVSLFDGKSFAGWEHNGNWEIRQGAFVRVRGGGALTYAKALVPDDFELRFEWKVSKECNSGVYYRPAQYEYQILDNVHSPYGENPRQAAGSLFFCMAPSKDATKPFGQWNSGRIKCKGTVIEHWVNGERVLSFDYTDPKWADMVKLLKMRGADLTARGGRLWLQDHGQDVWFRKLRWREIPADEPVAANPKFVPLPVKGEALKKEQERVRKMLKARKLKTSGEMI